MSKIKNESQLLEKLKSDIAECDQEEILFLAGHFPLFYSEKKDVAIENLTHWGHFSVYTLELACELGKYAVSLNKKVKFVFFVDDHAYEEISGLQSSARSKRRNNLYRLRDGNDAKLPEIYSEILNRHGFDEANVLRHNHEKEGRTNNLYFSEKILRSSTKQIENACAREYTEFLENPHYFNKKEMYLIAFIPNRCKSHICDVALRQEVSNIHASHIFMETRVPASDKKELFTTLHGVTYHKE